MSSAPSRPGDETNPFAPPGTAPAKAAEPVRPRDILWNTALLIVVFLGLTYLIGSLGAELPPNRTMFYLLLPVLPLALLTMVFLPGVNPFVVAGTVSIVIGVAVLIASLRNRKPSHPFATLLIGAFLGLLNGAFCRAAWFVMHNTFPT